MLLTEEQKRHYTAFWDRTPTDRACLHLISWDGSAGYPAPASLDQQWADPDYREKRALYETEHTLYHADAFPNFFTNFGPGSLAACVGGTYKFSPSTVWFANEPYFVEDWENRKAPVLDRESTMYKLVEDLLSRLLTHTDKFVTSPCDIGGTYDVIASLRGTENLLYDMYDYPEEVKKFRDEIAPIWKTYYLEQTARLFKAQGCMSSWMPIWSDKTYYPLQCDYSALISPDMFKEFVLPDLIAQTEYMERSIYHLDGTGELPHLDYLLSIPRLNAIQWVPGDGRPDAADPCWYETLNRIQAAGKGVVILGARVADLEGLFKHVSQRGLFVLAAVRDAKEADEVVDMAKKLYV